MVEALATESWRVSAFLTTLTFCDLIQSRRHVGKEQKHFTSSKLQIVASQIFIFSIVASASHWRSFTFQILTYHFAVSYPLIVACQIFIFLKPHLGFTSADNICGCSSRNHTVPSFHAHVFVSIYLVSGMCSEGNDDLFTSLASWRTSLDRIICVHLISSHSSLF